MLCFPMPIISLPGANPSLPEHKIGIFVRFASSFSAQRPLPQQTSFGGEKYSGLASNLAHLGRIC